MTTVQKEKLAEILGAAEKLRIADRDTASETDNNGQLSLAEVKEIGEELGIPGQYVERAVHASTKTFKDALIENPPFEVEMGGVITYFPTFNQALTFVRNKGGSESDILLSRKKPAEFVGFQRLPSGDKSVAQKKSYEVVRRRKAVWLTFQATTLFVSILLRCMGGAPFGINDAVFYPIMMCSLWYMSFDYLRFKRRNTAIEQASVKKSVSILKCSACGSESDGRKMVAVPGCGCSGVCRGGTHYFCSYCDDAWRTGNERS